VSSAVPEVHLVVAEAAAAVPCLLAAAEAVAVVAAVEQLAVAAEMSVVLADDVHRGVLAFRFSQLHLVPQDTRLSSTPSDEMQPSANSVLL
jgi:hypothetical protein